MEQVGHGLATFRGENCEGVVREVTTIQDVLGLLNEGDGGWILLVHDASATNIAPLLDRARGIICTRGGRTSHLALVAGEFGVPCIMGAELNTAGSLNRQTVILTAEGLVFVANNARKNEDG